MRFHWIGERQNKDFKVFWDKGCENKADYHTKHHPPAYHRTVRPNYILKGFNMIQMLKPFYERAKNLQARVC